MGCLESKIQPDPYGSYGFNNSGGGSGASVGESCCTVEDNSVSEWKQKMSEADALALFESDGTLPKNSTRGQLELRALLSEPVSQPILGNYAKSHNGLNFFLCWIDIQEYKSIETGPYRLSKAVLLYKKYIEAGSILDIQLNDDEKDVIEASLELSKTDNVPISNSFYTEAQKFCFEQIYHKLFVPFKKTDEYRALTKILKESYNFVRTDDFVYIKKLGEGGFGFVVQAMKLSTRQHYAMKIQTKRGLLSCFPEDPWRADSERKALATSQHPFIINLEYAFQTDTLAIMVLGLGTSGDLRHALRQSISRTLPFDRVQFYAAEMVSGLCHLHDMGLIYRDLKPNNILLNADGHIQLVDLGAVADTDGYVLEVEENPEDPPDVLAVFETASCQRAGRSPHLRSQAVSPAISPGNTHNPRYEGNEDKPLEPDQLVKMTKTTAVGDVETDEVKAAKAAIEAESGADPDDPNHVYIKSDVPVAKKKEDEMAAASSPEGQSLSIRKRAYTIIGTYGYMAPEMVILLSQEPHEKVGYTHSVDWWSLGATMYKLFTNDKPFQDFNVQQLMEIAPLYKGDLKFISKYAVLFTEIPPHANVNEVSMDIIKSLLNTDDTKRLGCGEQGAREIKNHPFFEGIDWEQLEAKQIPPPFIPERKQRSNAPQFDGFEDMMCQLGKEKWITEEMPKWNQQRYFGQWDYTSPQTLKLECQLAEEAAQYESHMGSWNKMSDKRKNLSLSELSEKLSIGITNPPKRSITQTIMQGLSPLASARKQEV